MQKKLGHIHFTKTNYLRSELIHKKNSKIYYRRWSKWNNVLRYFTAHKFSWMSADANDDIVFFSIKYINKYIMQRCAFNNVIVLQLGESIKIVYFFSSCQVRCNFNFLAKIIWTDESKFTNEGIVNWKKITCLRPTKATCYRWSAIPTKIWFYYICYGYVKMSRIGNLWRKSTNSAKYVNFLR